MNKVDEEQGDVDVQFMHLHGPRNTFNWSQGGDSCYVPIKNSVLYRHLLQRLGELTESVMIIMTTVAAFAKLHSGTAVDLCCENML